MKKNKAEENGRQKKDDFIQKERKKRCENVLHLVRLLWTTSDPFSFY